MKYTAGCSGLKRASAWFVLDCPAAGLKGPRNRRPLRTSRLLFRNIWRQSGTRCKAARSGKSRWQSELPKTPGVPHLRAVRALEKAGFRIVREGYRDVQRVPVRYVL